MRETFVDRHCAALPGTAREVPFGDETVIWTVHGHMFAAYMLDGQGLSLRVGDADSAQRMSKRKRSIANPYLSGSGWVLVPWSTGPDNLRTQLDESYRLVLGDRNAMSAD